MPNYYDRCLKAILLAIVALAILPIAVNAADGDVVAIRTVHSAVDPACFVAGDLFAVTLDYSVTGKHINVEIQETLPTGWIVVDSSHPHHYDIGNNIVKWNITEPIFGVVDGQIQYMVVIPDSAADNFTISGTTAWYNTFPELVSTTPNGTHNMVDTQVKVIGCELNGPTCWISGAFEEAGDGDGHLENGDYAAFPFVICDRNGVTDFETYINGFLCENITDIQYYDFYGGSMITGIGHAKVTIQPDCRNIFSLWANDTGGNESLFSYNAYVPYHDNKAWSTMDWRGMLIEYGAMGFTSSHDGGNWMYMHGGNPMDVPYSETEFDGVPLLDMNMTIMNCTVPMLCELEGANYRIVSTYGPDEIVCPYETYPTYCEYGDMNDVSATFMGSDQLAHQCFHVVLVNQTYITGKLNMSSAEAFQRSLGTISMTDLFNTQIGYAEVKADGNGDFVIDGTKMPELNDMQQGLYQLIVFDKSLPNHPIVISTSEVVVAKNDVVSECIDPAPMPGDSMTFFCSLEGPTAPPGTNYTYAVAMIPLDEYYQYYYNYCDNTWNGTSTYLESFSMEQLYNISSGGTTNTTNIYMTGRSGTYLLNGVTMKNTTYMKEIMQNEFNNSSAAIGFISTDATSLVEVVVQTRTTMPEGWFVVLTGVMDRDFVSMTAMDQQYVYLGPAYDLELACGWNLVSTPLVCCDEPQAFFEPCSDNIIIVWAYDPCYGWQYYVPGAAGNTLTCITEKMGIWVLTDCECTLPCIGGNPYMEEIPVFCGWNLVGYPKLEEVASGDEFWSINDNCTIIWTYENGEWLYYIPGCETNTLEWVRSGYGYWILMTEDQCFHV